MPGISRRRLLKTGGSTLAVGALASLSGCSGVLGNGGGPGPDRIPEPGDPTYRRWFVGRTDEAGEPQIYGGSEFYFDHEWLRSASDVLPGGIDFHLEMKVWMDYFGVGYDRIKRTLTGGYTIVIEGEFTRGEVVEGLGETGYAPAGTHRGYRLFARDYDPRAMAAGDGTVVMAMGSEEDSTPADVLRPRVDVIAGAAPSLHEASELFAETTGIAGAYPYMVLGFLTTTPETASVSTIGWAFGESRTFCRNVSGFLNADDVSAAAVKDAAKGHLGRPYELVTSGTEGRVAHATYAVEPPAYDVAFGEGRGDPEDYPLATFGAEYDADAGEVTFHHEAGEPVPSDTVRIDRNGSVEGTPEVSTDLAPGSSVTVGANPGDEVHLVWVRPTTSTSSATLVDYEVPTES